MPELSLIVPTLEAGEELPVSKALSSIDSVEYELLIQRERGVSHARNAGIERASTNKLVFLDDDSRPLEGFFDTACDVLDREQLVAGRILDTNTGIVGRLPRHYDHGAIGQYITMATGCNMAVRREVFQAVGGFDERYDWGHEETDLVKRAIDAGYRVWYEPDLVIEHDYVTSLPDFFRKMWRLGQSKVYFNRKHEVALRYRVQESVPFSLWAESADEFVVRSIGNGVCGVSKLSSVIGGVPDHTKPAEPAFD